MSDDKTTRRFRQDTINRIDAVRNPRGVSFVRIIDAFSVAWLELERHNSDRIQEAIAEAPLPSGAATGRGLWDSTCDRLDGIAERTKITVNANLAEVLLCAWTKLSADEQRHAIETSGLTPAQT